MPKNLSPQQSKLFEALSKGKLSRPAVAELIWGEPNKIGDASQLVHELRRRLAGTGSTVVTDYKVSPCVYRLVQGEDPGLLHPNAKP